MAALVARRTGADILRDKTDSLEAPASLPKSTETTQKDQHVTKDEAQVKPKFSYATADTLPLVDRFIDEPRPLRVAVIGGGLTGILAGILLPAKVPGIELTIYEKNHDFGGTWLENVYPGVRCDIPSHVYQSTFAPKKDWSDEFAPGAEIREYWQSVARKHDVYKLARFNERVTATDWDAAKSKWIVSSSTTAKDDAPQQQEEYDFVLTAIGRFNNWKLPDYPGIETYTGHLRHTSNWDPSFDPAGKKVAVIGNGASGIQVVANLQKVVSRLDHYARSKTWIASSWAGDDRTLEPQPITQDKIQGFQENEASYLQFRKVMEDKYWRRFDTFLKGTENNAVLRAKFTDIMQKRLGSKTELLAKDIVPEWSPNCRRLTPGPGYLEAIGQDNVDYIRTKIRRFTPTGIETEDGIHRQVDAVLCATGSRSSMIPAFRVSANDQTLEDVWTQHGFPYTYLGVAVPKFPNFLFVQGPHGTAPSGTVPQSVESQLAHFAKLLRKVSREGTKSIVPSKAAADDFVAYCDAFFKQSVVSENCSSWYNGGKPGARVHGIWPGSAVHLTMVRREPRWEDWEYEYLEDSGNRFFWYFGNGGTKKERDLDEDVTEYLHGGKTDLRDVHESWWRVP